ncbi:MAG: hypothetical protein ACTHOP_20220, partial [Mesorhizobium sp.]
MTIAVSGLHTAKGIAKWKAEAAKRAAVDDVARQIERITRIAAKEGIVDRAAKLMDDAARKMSRTGITYTTIERRLCRIFKVTPEAVNGRMRSVPTVVLCRQAIMYWACRRI